MTTKALLPPGKKDKLRRAVKEGKTGEGFKQAKKPDTLPEPAAKVHTAEESAELTRQLGVAAENGNLREVKRLVEQEGADVNGMLLGTNGTLSAACFGGNLRVVRYLLSKGANIEAQNMPGYTPLIIAIEKKHVDIVEFLLEQGADPNHLTKTQETPLIRACYARNVEIVEMLLAKNVDVNIRPIRGKTALGIAIEVAVHDEDREIIQLLRRAGARE